MQTVVCQVGEVPGTINCTRTAKMQVQMPDGDVFICVYHADMMVDYFRERGINAPVRGVNERMTVNDKIRRNAETLNPEFYRGQ